jgi:hypothetical protein
MGLNESYVYLYSPHAASISDQGLVFLKSRRPACKESDTALIFRFMAEKRAGNETKEKLKALPKDLKIVIEEIQDDHLR